MSEFILNNQIAFYYSLIGAAFLVLTFEPALRSKFFFNIPILYIAVGVLSALIGLPIINPLNSDLELSIVVHMSEMIVIISLAGAGLSIDLKAGWERWQTTWRLLAITMPLTILSVMFLGLQFAGLSLATAVLLGAAIAPTDPVLARSVSVGSPNSEQRDTQTALTSEAGLNDGLAFPFVWLAIGLAVMSTNLPLSMSANFPLSEFAWGDWLLKDVLYRIVAGVGVGLLTGAVITKILFSRVGDAQNGRNNVVLFVLAATFMSYGLAEFIHGYGFLSVFIAARAGRALTKNTKAEPYENEAHESADQLEAILLAVILLWFGSFIGGVLWPLWTWTDAAIAAAIILLIRPIAGWIALIGHDIDRIDRLKIAFFGIRGMGSIFYVAYALAHANFSSPERAWSILSLTILFSAALHGSLARTWMNEAK